MTATADTIKAQDVATLPPPHPSFPRKEPFA